MTTTDDFEVKPLPGYPSTCRTCQRAIVWAVTVAGPNGPGGKRMPLNPRTDPKGNAAVSVGIGGALRVRVLSKGERHDVTLELLAMPHFATCHEELGKDLIGEVETFLEQRAGDSEATS